MRPKSQARVGTSNRLSAEAMAAAAPTRATTPGQRLRSTPLAVSPRSSASTAMIAAVSTSSGPKYRRLWVAPMRLARGDRLGQRREARDPGVDGDDGGEAAEAADLTVVRPVVDDAHEEEEHGSDRPVVEHLEDRAVDPLRREGRHAEHHVAHVADARIGDELLEILLRHGAHRAVDDVERAERGQEPAGDRVPAPEV